MADNNILFHIKVDDKGTITHLKATREGFKDIDLTVKNAKKSQELLTQAIKQMGKSGTVKGIKLTQQEYDKLIKTQHQLKNATGATTSAALELGRVVQDAPYGIRGMANNITQLVSQLGYAAKATGSWTNAIKGMIGSLTGTLGVVFAVSVVVSLLESFVSSSNKAEEATEDLNESLREEVETLNNYKQVIDDVNISFTEMSGVIKAVGKSSPEFLKMLKESEDSLGMQTELLNKYIKEKNDELKVSDAVNKVNEINSELRKEEATDIDKLIEKREELKRSIDVMSGYLYGKELNDAKRAFETKIKFIQGLIDKHGERRDLLVEINELIKEEDDKPPLKGSVDWYKDVISSMTKTRDSMFKVGSKGYKQETKLINQLTEELKKLKGEFDEERDRVEYAVDLTMVDNEKIEKQIKKLKKKMLSIVAKNFDVDLKTNPLSIAPKLNTNLSEKTQSEIDEYNKNLVKEISRNLAYQDFQDYANTFKEGLSVLNDFIDGEFQRELTIEQNKTNALNEELNNRLLNEQLSADERKKIQNQIWQNDENLRKKQNEIKKKQFNSQKAFNIANALVDTGRAAAGVMAEAKGGFFARLAQAIPTIAFGLAQVAMIARQKFQPESASTPIRTASGAGGAGGVGNRTFDFNLVGQSRENQLAEAIGGQFDKPIKAYVVSKDVTNQQELDANIKSNARFGG